MPAVCTSRAATPEIAPAPSKGLKRKISSRQVQDRTQKVGESSQAEQKRTGHSVPLLSFWFPLFSKGGLGWISKLVFKPRAKRPELFFESRRIAARSAGKGDDRLFPLFIRFDADPKLPVAGIERKAYANGHENETGPHQPDSRVFFDLESCKSRCVDSNNPDLVVFDPVAVKRPVSQNPLGRGGCPAFA